MNLRENVELSRKCVVNKILFRVIVRASIP